MHLTKYFNQNFMIQNLKKSKSILAFFLGIIPILSIIVFLMMTAGTQNISRYSLEIISIIHYVGIYFIPIILSICLFGFVYKRKSVDFINSMPLSRKTIFTTNTISGIILIILMVVLSGFGIYFASTFTNVILPFRMIVDYIIIWTISYIFVFILTNIAMSITGNAITQIVLTVLLLFLVPITTDYVNYSLNHNTLNNEVLCIEQTNSEDEICSNIETEKHTNYTIPYNNLRELTTSNVSLWNIISLVKMAIISVIGYIIGKILFQKRKMEDNETSFKNLRTHNIVKGLTMFPIIIAISQVTDYNTTSLIFIFILLIAYYFIYDLITKKSISEIKKSLVHFVITIVILFAGCNIINSINNNKYLDNTFSITENQITAIDLSLNEDKLNNMDYIRITDEKIIQTIMNLLKNKDEEVSVFNKTIRLVTKNSSYKIDSYIYANAKEYEKIMSEISKLKNQVKSPILTKTSDIYALSYNENEIVSSTDNHTLLKEAVNVMKNNNVCKNEEEKYEWVTIYAYQNGLIESKTIKSCTSKKIEEFVKKAINDSNKKLIKKINNVSYTAANNLLGIDLMHGFEFIDKEKIDELYSIMFEVRKELYNFIKKYKDDEIDLTKDSIILNVYYGGKNYNYTTNRIEEFNEIIKLKKEEMSYDND